MLTPEKLEAMSLEELKKTAKGRKIQFDSTSNEDTLRTLISESLSDEAAQHQENVEQPQPETKPIKKVDISTSAPLPPAGVEEVKIKVLIEIPNVKLGKIRYSFRKDWEGKVPRAVAAHFVNCNAAVIIK